LVPPTTSRGNVILGKLEGNNPAGSVKDRPALSMIQRAEERGDIKPGDTLIEATSGNTGIALAMAAAIKGYRMVLIMPEDLSIERAQTMKAFGAELMLTPKSGGMEYARDLAEHMQREGKGRVLDQFANADNPRIHYETTGPEIWADTGGKDHPLCQRHGHHRHHHRRVAFLKEKNPADPDHWGPAVRGLAHSRHPQMAAGVPAQDLRPQACGRTGVREPGRCRRHVPPPGARRGHLCRHLGRWRLLGGPGDCPREENATIVFIVCDRGDRYLSTGVFPA
jgi:cysteine synthase B